MTTLTDKIVTARRSHTCESCLQGIPPGNRYRRIVRTGYDYDGLQTLALCQPCENLSHDLFLAGIEGEDPVSGCPAYPILTDVDLDEVNVSELREQLHQWQWRFKSHLHQMDKASA